MKIAGDVDISTEIQFRQALDDWVARAGGEYVYIDLTGIRFISIQGVRILAEVLHRARRRNLDVEVLLAESAGRIVRICWPFVANQTEENGA